MDIHDLLRILKSNLRRHMRNTEFVTVTTFIDGRDEGSDGALLRGFPEYLQMRLGQPSNLM